MKRILFLFVILNLILIPGVLANQGHMKLLAVKETESGALEGGVADLYLEIKPGSGRVFLETFPLTKTDTQMSTRFAKAIACDTLELDCNDVDFFYTISADSPIIAGPSAGSSIALLTMAMLQNINLREDYAATGTINSGGFIGHVGGVKEKVEAAKKAGMKKVMIPAGEAIIKTDNSTIDIINLSKKLGIRVVEVSTLSQAYKEFTGKELGQKYTNIEISPEYRDTMKSVAKDLCDRSNKLRAETSNLKYSLNASIINLVKENAANLTSKGRIAFEQSAFYSGASYCFGANVEYSTLSLLARNLSKEDAVKEAQRMNNDVSILRKKVESKERKTITDLEAYMVVEERISEAEETISQALATLNNTNKTEKIVRTLAYANERINSANSWSNFLGKPGKAFNLNKDVLKKSCQTKISEADEREQYVELYFPNTLENVKNGIKRANSELQKGNYELCLSEASKAKADVDIILSVFGVDPEQYRNVVETKLEIVKNNIARQSNKGVFPILGYSYYEYANSLKESDVFSALLYSEYALELGNLDIYFKESNGKKANYYNIDSKLIGIFFIGVLVGGIAVSLVKRKGIVEKKKGKKRK